MSPRKSLILAGGTVALLAPIYVRASRRKRAPQISHLSPFPTHWKGLGGTLTLYLLATPSLTYDIDWGGVWGGIWNFLGDVSNAVREWVKEAIHKAVSAAMAIVNMIKDITDAAIHAIEGGLWALQDLAGEAVTSFGRVIDGTWDMVNGAFSNFRQQMADIFAHAWDSTERLLRTLLPDALESLLGDVWDFLKALSGIGWNGINFLINLVTDPINFLWMLLKDLVDDAIDAAKDVNPFDLEGLLREILERAKWALEWVWKAWWTVAAAFYGEGIDPQALIDAWLLWMRFLVWLAKGAPEDDLVDLVGDGMNYVKSEVKSETRRQSEFLIKILYKLLGVDASDTPLGDAIRKV